MQNDKGRPVEGFTDEWLELADDGLSQVASTDAAFGRGFARGMQHGQEIGYQRGFLDGQLAELRQIRANLGLDADPKVEHRSSGGDLCSCKFPCDKQAGDSDSA